MTSLSSKDDALIEEQSLSFAEDENEERDLTTACCCRNWNQSSNSVGYRFTLSKPIRICAIVWSFTFLRMAREKLVVSRQYLPCR